MRFKLQSNLFSCLLLIGVLGTNLLSQELHTPAPSPKGTVSQIVGLTEVSITYHRPGVKGRKIFGKLVPYGELWRTGANNSTTIKVSNDVKIGGQDIAAGEYALFTIPQQDEWTVIISKNIGWGTNDYQKEGEIARFTVQSMDLSSPVERLTIEIADMTHSGANVILKWDRTAVTFPIEVDTDAQVMNQIDELMKNPPQDNANVYYRAANYYFETDKDLKQSLKWLDKSLAIDPDAYWIVRLKSRVQAKMGNYQEAIETAKIGIETARKAENNQYVKYNQEAIAEWSKQVK